MNDLVKRAKQIANEKRSLAEAEKRRKKRDEYEETEPDRIERIMNDPRCWEGC